MNFLEIVGSLFLFGIVSLFLYSFIISPILDYISMYKYYTRINQLENLERDLEYLLDKLYMLNNDRLTIEKCLKNKRLLSEVNEEYLKNHKILKEEMLNSIGTIIESDEPQEFSKAYYQARENLYNLKNKLGIK